MSNYYLCAGKEAKHPFYVESAGISLYSIEEVCYFLYHNLYLAGEALFVPEFYKWLRKELGLNDLALRLEKAQKDFVSMENLCFPIVREANYLSYEEKKKFSSRLSVYQREPRTIHLKKKADAMVESGLYMRAINVYQIILNLDEKSMPESFSGTIWYNMGCTYSYLFQNEKALECFRTAYELMHSGQTLRAYLMMAFQTLTEKEYEELTIELGVDEQTKQEIKEECEKKTEENKMTEEEVEEALSRLTKEYHRSTSD